MRLRTWMAAIVVAGISALAAGPARALVVDLELVLAVDVSRSMDAEELELQRAGYAGAFIHPAVISAITGGPNRRIAVCMVEWAGAHYQQVIVPWTLVDGADAAESLSALILATPKLAYNWTSISGAIDFSTMLFTNNGFEGNRLVIDISGDGINNNGRPAAEARDAAVAQGITINGIVIMNDRPGPGGWRPAIPPQPLDEHYRDNVIGGPGAFVIKADDFDSFAYAIRNKLIREISGLPGPLIVNALRDPWNER